MTATTIIITQGGVYVFLSCSLHYFTYMQTVYLFLREVNDNQVFCYCFLKLYISVFLIITPFYLVFHIILLPINPLIPGVY